MGNISSWVSLLIVCRVQGSLQYPTNYILLCWDDQHLPPSPPPLSSFPTWLHILTGTSLSTHNNLTSPVFYSTLNSSVAIVASYISSSLSYDKVCHIFRFNSMIEIVSHKPPQGLIDGALVVDEDSRRLECWGGEPGGSLWAVTQELAGELASPPTIIPPGIRLKYFHWL